MVRIVLISIMLCLAPIISYAQVGVGNTQSTYSSVQERRPGDVNGDGFVNISDIVAIINCIAGTADEYISTANVNGNETIDISDFVKTINIIAGIDMPEEYVDPNEPDAAVTARLCPDNHHPHIIDMGQPDNGRAAT